MRWRCRGLLFSVCVITRFPMLEYAIDEPGLSSSDVARVFSNIGPDCAFFMRGDVRYENDSDSNRCYHLICNGPRGAGLVPRPHLALPGRRLASSPLRLREDRS